MHRQSEVTSVDLLGWCAGARVCAYVLAFASPSLYSVLRPGQALRASASVSSRVFGRRGVAPAPRLELCVRWDDTCCARGGCRAGLRLLHSVCVCGILASCMYSALIGGLLPCAACSVVGLRW